MSHFLTIFTFLNLRKTSFTGEVEKNGVVPEKLPELFSFINDKCECLMISGLMTIGAFGFDYTQGPNPDFEVLMKCLSHLPDSSPLQVSFGMSDDFEQAVSFQRKQYLLVKLSCNYRFKWEAQLSEWEAQFLDSVRKKIRTKFV